MIMLKYLAFLNGLLCLKLVFCMREYPSSWLSFAGVLQAQRLLAICLVRPLHQPPPRLTCWTGAVKGILINFCLLFLFCFQAKLKTLLDLLRAVQQMWKLKRGPDVFTSVIHACKLQELYMLVINCCFVNLLCHLWLLLREDGHQIQRQEILIFYFVVNQSFLWKWRGQIGL